MPATAKGYVHHKASGPGVVFGVILLEAIGLPGLVMAPSLQAAVIFAVTSLLSFGLFLLWNGRVELSHDRAARTVRLVDVRWPLPGSDRVIPFDSIERVETRNFRRNRWTVIVLGGPQPETLYAGGPKAEALLNGWLSQQEKR